MNSIVFSLFTVGVISIISQTLLIRELLVVFSGNELTIGIIIANWVVMMAVGSVVFGRFTDRLKNRVEVLVIIQIICALFLPLSVYLVRNLKNMFGIIQGQVPGFHAVFYMSLVPIVPIAVCIGMMFTLSTRIYHEYIKSAPVAIGRGYAIDAIGDITGGIVFTYILVARFHSVDIMLISLCLVLFAANLLSCRKASGTPRAEPVAPLIIPPVLFPTHGIKQVGGINTNMHSSPPSLFAQANRGETLPVFRMIVRILLFVCLLILIFGYGGVLQNFTVKTQWKGYDTVFYGNSIYSNIVVVKSEEQYTLFSNGMPIINIPVPDTVFVEEFAHIPLLHHDSPQKLLLIGGGAGGLLNELLKHPLKKITYVELDPLIIDTIKKFPTDLTTRELNDSRVNLIYTDARHFVAVSTEDRYDVILLNTGAPMSLETNRYYTIEFFKLLKNRLNPDGILTISLPCSLTYINDELKSLHHSVLKALKRVYQTIKIIPGESICLYICSPQVTGITSLDSDDLISRILKRNIKTRLLTPVYIKYRFQEKWLDWFMDSLKMGSESFFKCFLPSNTNPAKNDSDPIFMNKDFHPVGLFYSLNYLNAMLSPRLAKIFNILVRIDMKLIIVFLFCLFAVIFLLTFTKKKRNIRTTLPSRLIVLTTGTAGMGYTIMLLLSFQVYYGYLYYKLGLLTSLFMAGLAAGSLAATAYVHRLTGNSVLKLLFRIELLIVAFTLMFPFLVIIIYKFELIFYLLMLTAGFVVGIEFPVVSKIYFSATRRVGHTIGMLYATDLLGAWVGAIIISIWFLPVYGLLSSCLFLVILKLFSFISVFFIGTVSSPLEREG